MVQEHNPSDPTQGHGPSQGNPENANSQPAPAEHVETDGGSWLLEPAEVQADTPVVLEDASADCEAAEGPATSFDNGHLEASYVAAESTSSLRAAFIPITVGAVLAFAGSAVVSLRKRQSTDSAKFPQPIALTEDVNPEVELAGPIFDTQSIQSKKTPGSNRRAIDRDGSIAPAKVLKLPAVRKPSAAPKRKSQARLSKPGKQAKQLKQDQRAAALGTPPPLRPSTWDEIPAQSTPSLATEAELAQDLVLDLAQAIQTEDVQQRAGTEGSEEIVQPEQGQLTAALGTPPPMRPSFWDELPAQSKPSTAVQAEPAPALDLAQDLTLSPDPDPTSAPTSEGASMASITVKDPFPMSVVIEPAPWFGDPTDLSLEQLWPGPELGFDSVDDLAAAGEPQLVEQESLTEQESEAQVFAELETEPVAEEPIHLPDAELLALESWPGEFMEFGAPESLPVVEEWLAATRIAPTHNDEYWLGPNGVEWISPLQPVDEPIATQVEQLADQSLSPEVAALLALSESELEEQRRRNGLEVGPQLEPQTESTALLGDDEERDLVAQVSTDPGMESALESDPGPSMGTTSEPAPIVTVSVPEELSEPSPPRGLLHAYSDWMRVANMVPMQTPALSAVNGVPGCAYSPYGLSKDQGPVPTSELAQKGEGVDVALSSAPLRGGVLRRASSDHRWEGFEVPEHAIGVDRKLLTPNVGPVRIDLVDGQSLEGRLHSVGFHQLWLATNLGHISLERRRVARIEKLDPGLGMPMLYKSKDYSGLPLVRVVAKGGTFVGHQISREGRDITMVTEKGFRISLTDVEISPARQYRAVDLRRVDDYGSKPQVAAE